MKKLLLLALSLLFMLAACKAKTAEPKAQAPEHAKIHDLPIWLRKTVEPL